MHRSETRGSLLFSVVVPVMVVACGGDAERDPSIVRPGLADSAGDPPQSTNGRLTADDGKTPAAGYGQGVSVEPAEAALPVPLLLLACTVGSDLPEPDLSGATPAEIALQGNIVEVGVGLFGPADDGTCPFVSGYRIGSAISVEDLDVLAQQTWIRIADPRGNETVLTVVAPGFRFASDVVGEDVELKFTAHIPDYFLHENWLELRRADGPLILWLAEASSVEGLVGAEEIERTLGAVESERAGSCVTRSEQRKVDVVLDGIRADVGYAEQVPVGRWSVTNAGTSVQTGETTCPDAHANGARMAVWANEHSVPYASGVGGWCDPALTALYGAYYEDKTFLCLEDAPSSSWHLTLSCNDTIACPIGAICSEDVCRVP